ncbi:RIP metalloprotease RseP [Pinisolibacter aquiterrae]|uniref:RIP metalloprotease RseP n=1 Tax=Pinisolibacter aquiterrae TaxID=2815579 RepID=UPI001C3D8904|nr:RIP metalloprotease RseP [Pinisolibacter aquiterrae]MBV5264292.1 RIP metalloprotease RseP [Pinisolibacter aquiterrae]MCC8234559.1 RIP metalloprotease RseP [Pinisolibacter aquiterrae]
MEILNEAVSLVGYVPPFLFVLTIVVFFHELGHFLVGRACGVGVVTFSIGFGPELFGWNDRHGTRWRVSLIPLGGYVKFVGDEGAASTPDRDGLAALSPADRDRAFQTKSVGRRAAIVAAGPIANFILAVVIFSGLFMVSGRVDLVAKVGDVTADGVAAEAGIRAGDLIVAIDGHPIETFMDVMRLVSERAGEKTDFVVERDGARIETSLTPRLVEEKSRFGVQRRGLVGIRASNDPADRRLRRFSPPEAVVEGAKETWFVVARTASYLGGIFTGRESIDQLGGPLRVAQISGEVAGMGIAALINLAAVLSVSIGLLNLFPVPMLDGGHLVFYAAEAVRGRPLSDRAQDIGFRIGMALILMLMLVSSWNDIAHLASLRRGG